MLLEFRKVNINEFFNLSIIENSNFQFQESVRDDKENKMIINNLE
jgi:hypothetical protein